MIDAITSSQLAMNSDKLQLSAVSQNIANMHTPGFKRELAIQAPFDKLVDTDLETVASQLQVAQLHRQATLDKTNRPLDVALSGEGYFTVQTDDGVHYTRRGDFKRNSKGELVTFDDQRVMGKGGAIRIDGNEFQIKKDGTIIIDNKPSYQLNVVKFTSSAHLQALSNGYFQSQQTPQPMDASISVHQGYLEQSNVKSVEEMLMMTKLARHFEASQRVMKTADEMLSQAVSQLGEG